MCYYIINDKNPVKFINPKIKPNAKLKKNLNQKTLSNLLSFEDRSVSLICSLKFNTFL